MAKGACRVPEPGARLPDHRSRLQHGSDQPQNAAAISLKVTETLSRNGLAARCSKQATRPRRALKAQTVALWVSLSA